MKTVKETAQTKPSGSSANGGKHEKPAAETEKKRPGRKATEGEPLRRILVFLGESAVDALRKKAGDGKVSTKVRELVKAFLGKA
jgi:hypothetical protein